MINYSVENFTLPIIYTVQLRDNRCDVTSGKVIFIILFTSQVYTLSTWVGLYTELILPFAISTNLMSMRCTQYCVANNAPCKVVLLFEDIDSKKLKYELTVMQQAHQLMLLWLMGRSSFESFFSISLHLYICEAHMHVSNRL